MTTRQQPALITSEQVRCHSGAARKARPPDETSHSSGITIADICRTCKQTMQGVPHSHGPFQFAWRCTERTQMYTASGSRGWPFVAQFFQPLITCAYGKGSYLGGCSMLRHCPHLAQDCPQLVGPQASGVSMYCLGLRGSLHAQQHMPPQKQTPTSARCR